MANRQLFAPQILGYCPGTTASSTFALSAAANWIALSIIPKANGTLNAVRAFLSAVTGTLTAANLTCEIQTDNSGVPSGTAVSGGSAQPCAAIPVVGSNNWTGFTCALNNNTPYWAVFKNLNGTPTSNFPTFKNFNTTGVLPANLWAAAAPSTSSCFGCPTTTNAGTSWTANRNAFPNVRLAWSDGSYEGLPISNQAAISTIANGSTEPGIKFTLPGNSFLTSSVAGIILPLNISATPAGFPQYKLYLGNSTTATAAAGPSGTANYTSAGANLVPLYFVDGSGNALPQSITGGQTVRITLSSSVSETGSNGYKIGMAATLDSDTNSLPLAPFEGTWQQTVLSGGAWTDTQGILPYGGLILDSTGELSAAAGGSGDDSAAIILGPMIWW